MPASKAIWNFAGFEARRNKKNRVLRLFIGMVENEPDFLLDISVFSDRVCGQADNHNLAFADGLAYCDVPILPRQNILVINPRLVAIGLQPVVELADTLLVTRPM